MKQASLNDLKMELWLRVRDSIIWTTKDGKDIPISKMSTSHIINTIKMIKREQQYNDLLMEAMSGAPIDL